jgi:S1-C subfamily serine protease
MIRVRGQDSLGVKTLGRPFHKMSGGFTTLSASGLLIDRRLGYALTSSTILSPFMLNESLRKGVVIEMLTNGLSGILDADHESNMKWIPLKLVRILKDDSMHSLLQRFRGDSDWTAGWPRGSDSSSGHLGEMDLARRESMSSAFWAGYEDLALLQIENEQVSSSVRAKLLSIRRDLQQQPFQLELNIVDPATVQRGNHLMMIASPYGILSPSVFHNCIYTAMVSNVISLDANNKPLNQQMGTLDINDTSSLGPPITSSLQFSTPQPSSSSSYVQQPQTQPTLVSSTIQQGKARARRLKSAVLSNSLDKQPSSSIASPQSTSSNPCVILIDQSGLPGCEGGPVFDSKGNLIGLLAPPLRRSDGSNVEVHLVLPIHPFLSQIRELTSKQVSLFDRKVSVVSSSVRSEFKLEPVSSQSSSSPSQSSLSPQVLPNSTSIINRILPSIVVISTGSFWGSGVIVSSDGFILTSAHIFRSFLASTSTPYQPILKSGYHVDIRIDFGTNSNSVPSGPPSSSSSSSSSRGTSSASSSQTFYGPSKPYRTAHWYRANLIFVSSSHLDVAIIKIDRPPSHLTVLSICDPNVEGSTMRDLLEGEPVIALGFALFGPSKRIMATSTSGVISRVAHLYGQPKLIQTSASVNKGASGGALIDSKGKFIGLVTCNAMTKEGIIIPKINFSIPSHLLLPVHEFIISSNKQCLEAIERKDESCAALWSMSTVSDEPDSIITRPIPSSPSSKEGENGSHSEQQETIQRGTKLLEFWNSQTNIPLIPKARL